MSALTSVLICFCQKLLFMLHSSEGGCKPHNTSLLTAAAQKHTYTPTDTGSESHTHTHDVQCPNCNPEQKAWNTWTQPLELQLGTIYATQEARSLPWRRCGGHFGSIAVTSNKYYSTPAEVPWSRGNAQAFDGRGTAAIFLIHSFLNKSIKSHYDRHWILLTLCSLQCVTCWEDTWRSLTPDQSLQDWSTVCVGACYTV